MINEEFKRAIFEISERMLENSVKYAITGSANLALQGIKVPPQDVDIVVFHEDLQRIIRIFPEYLRSGVRKMESKIGDAWEVLLNIEGVDVQVFAEPSGKYSRALYDNSFSLDIDDRLIYCLPLEAELKLYRETGRLEKAKMIERFLKNKG